MKNFGKLAMPGTASLTLAASESSDNGGPLITLDAAGRRLSCRREVNGSVAVLRKFAN